MGLPVSIKSSPSALKAYEAKDAQVSRLRGQMVKAQSVGAKVGRGATVLTASAIAGLIDTRAPTIPLGSKRIPASLGVGLVLFGVSVAAKGAGRSVAENAALGMLCPHAYAWGAQVGSRS